MNDDNVNNTNAEGADTPTVEPSTAPVVESGSGEAVEVKMGNSTGSEPIETVESPQQAEVQPQFDESLSSEPVNSESPSGNNDTGVGESQEHEQSADTALPPPPAKKSKKKLIVFIIGLLLLAGAAVIAVLALSGGKDTKSETAATAVEIPLLQVASDSGPIGVDYFFPKPISTTLSTAIDFQVFEGLVGYDNQKIVPLLASSWTTPDSNTWVFKLKDNVKFHNGKTVTAQDVKTSLDVLRKDGDWGSFLQTISDVSITSPTEVTVKTASPDSLLLNRLTYGFVYSTNTDKTVSGTGAYTLDTENSKTETKTRLVAFDGYHQGKPMTRAVEYTIYGSTDEVTKALNEGKANYAYNYKNDTTATELAGKNFANYDYSNTGAYGLTQNMVKAGSPLQKIEVRQALALALDRNAFVTDTKSVRTATNYVVPKTVVGYDETAKYPDYNVTKAKELATKAGYPAGVPLTFNYIDKIQDDVPTLISQLNNSGFKITAKAYPSPKEFVAANRAGSYDLFAGRFETDLGDGLDIFSNLLGSTTSQFPSYNNPTFDKMLADAEKAFNPEEHVKKVQEINMYAKDQSLWVPISNSEFSIYYKDSYNFKLDSITGVNGVYFWKLADTKASTSSNQ